MPRSAARGSAARWAVMVLCMALGLTGLAWRRAEADEVLKLHLEFELGVRDAQQRIDVRMAAHEQVLRGAAALFAASEGVERAEFRDYVAALRLEEHYPGIQGVGFALVVPAADLARHLSEQQETVPDYQVRPSGPREVYTSIVFLEPRSGRNLRAIGYDMYAEPVRQEAMARARDEGRAVLSGKVTLVQETDEAVQAGVLMYLPVYRNGPPPRDAVERRARVLGWAYLPFRMDDLMAGILGEQSPDLLTRIYDGDSTRGALLYDSAGPDSMASPGFEAQRPMLVSGHPWTLSFGVGAPFAARLATHMPEFVALGGACLSLLVTALVWVFLRRRDHAMQWAFEMNRDLIQTHAALTESELRVRLALRGGDLGLWDWDLPSGRVTFNERWAEMLGYSLGELAPNVSSWEKLVHPEEQAAVDAALEAHLRGETASYACEHRLRHKDGHWVWVLDSGTVVLRGADGTPLRAAGTHLDITDRKLAEQDLKALQVRTAQAERLASLGTLAGGMAHEINNPLAIILANVGFVQEQLEALPGGPLLREVREALADAAGGSARVRDLVADLRSFASGQHLSGGQCDLVSALDRAARVAQHARAEDTTLSIDLPPSLPQVAGSEAELAQLFGCLLANAGQARGERALSVRITAELSGLVVKVRITDTGTGIAPEILPRIFDPFFTTRAIGSGKGLGLPVAQGIAQGLGGGIEVHSTQGQGTTVTVTLPAAPLSPG